MIFFLQKVLIFIKISNLYEISPSFSYFHHLIVQPSTLVSPYYFIKSGVDLKKILINWVQNYNEN